jgi:hypothetical protein
MNRTPKQEALDLLLARRRKAAKQAHWKVGVSRAAVVLPILVLWHQERRLAIRSTQVAMTLSQF